ncbi:MAG TPA: SRPBCC family protein [Acidimicrobiales bacterium]|nr:SRPBCC family protein [Acidimicrobiales bacterium]
MDEDRIDATVVIDAPAEQIFAVLADPSRHAAIDGTGWVRDPLDTQVLSAPGQIFRMAMYHPNHPDGSYQMANRVQVLDPPRTISWEPGNEAPDGTLSVPGWVWRYDLAPAGPSQTTVILSYDWSAVADSIRDRIGFPPFPPEHLDNSLAHLAELVAEQSGPAKS